MQSRVFYVSLILTLTILTVLPSSYIGLNRAHAFNMTIANSYNLPFGPEADQIVFQYYSDFTTMFNAFTTGGPNGIDITDWPMFPADSGGFCDPVAHPDWYCGSANINFGLFQVDINHDKSFLGVNQLEARSCTATTPGCTTPDPHSPFAPGTVSVSLTAGPAGCSTGFGSVSVQLQNQETGAVDDLFGFNSMTLTQVLSGGVLSGSTTLSGTGGTGHYSFPCVVAGTYLLSNSAYANCASSNIAPCEVSICPAPCTTGTTASAVFHSNWNSQSTQKYTQAGIYIRQAVRHLVDKPQFILGMTLQGQAQCADIYAAQPQGFPNGGCSGLWPAVPAAVLNAECPEIAASESTPGNTLLPADKIPCDPPTPPDMYLLNLLPMGQANVWWSTGPLADNGYPSLKDVQAACDLFFLAGFSITPSGNTCHDIAIAAFPAGTPPPPPCSPGPCISSYPHLILPGGQQIIFYDRTHLPRRAFGQITIDGLDFLFGTAQNGNFEGSGVSLGTCAVNYGFKSGGSGCTPAYYGFTDISNIIFADGVNTNTWNLYTGGESFGINPDNEYSTFNSVFASNYCGGAVATVISNYDIVCDPKLDAYTNAGEFADTFADAVNVFQNAAYVSAEAVSANPVYNLFQRFIALNSLSFDNAGGTEGSLVNGDGTGWLAGTSGAFSTLLNAHCNHNYTPVSSQFACGGADGTIRRGQSQDSNSFSPYQATSVWDFDVIDMVFDTLLRLNPDTGGPTLQLSNWMVTGHASSFNPSETSVLNPGSPTQHSVSGTTTQVWHLRPDLQFHDGTSVTADDVCFSILSYRDMPAALLQPSVINVASCTALNASTVQVKLGLTGSFYDDLVGGVPILPHHVWAAACNWPVGSPEPAPSVLGASQCANPSDDPMVPLSGQTTGRMIGSGAYTCLGVAGSAGPGLPGGPCSQTASGAPGTSSNTIRGKLFLTAFKNYHRGDVADTISIGSAGSIGSKYQKFSWADKFDTGLVTIADIADAALHNKHYDPYWASPLYSSSPATCSATGGPGTGNLQCVDIGDIGTIALYKGIGATDPIPLSQYVGLDPHIDRFDGGVAAPSGGVYLGGSGATRGSNSAQFSVFTGSTTTVTGVSLVGTTGLTSTTTGTCTATLVAPDGPGRTTYTCTFGTALAPDLNGDTELEITLTFFNSVTSTMSTTEVEIGTPSNALLVGFTFAPSFPVPGQTLSFTSTVTGIPGYSPVAPLTYSWDFGNGISCAGTSTSAGTCTGSAVNPSNPYTSSGTFTATLTVTDANGASGTISNIVVVAPFAVDFTCTKASLTVTCVATTTNGNPPFTYSWSFGGAGTGTSLAGANPTFTYSTAGTYTVILTITDSAGLVRTISHSETVP